MENPPCVTAPTSMTSTSEFLRAKVAALASTTTNMTSSVDISHLPLPRKKRSCCRRGCCCDAIWPTWPITAGLNYIV